MVPKTAPRIQGEAKVEKVQVRSVKGSMRGKACRGRSCAVSGFSRYLVSEGISLALTVLLSF